MCTHADDRLMSFDKRDDLIKKCKMMYEAIAKWGLTAHIRCNDKSLNYKP